ncbi:hypothetical protein CM49_00907 [Paenibacillus sp. P1XP2]|nr:hypothetical protein CM49_00907 [Paenibacillus sp. P1XP2]
METGKDPLWFRLAISALLMGLFMEWIVPLQPLDVLSVSREWFGVMYGFTAMLLLLGACCPRLPLLAPLYGLCTLLFWADVIAKSGEKAAWLPCFPCCAKMPNSLPLPSDFRH